MVLGQFLCHQNALVPRQLANRPFDQGSGYRCNDFKANGLQAKYCLLSASRFTGCGCSSLEVLAAVNNETVSSPP
jgi:hypothetical protein